MEITVRRSAAMAGRGWAPRSMTRFARPVALPGIRGMFLAAPPRGQACQAGEARKAQGPGLRLRHGRAVRSYIEGGAVAGLEDFCREAEAFGIGGEIRQHQATTLGDVEYQRCIGRCAIL